MASEFGRLFACRRIYLIERHDIDRTGNPFRSFLIGRRGGRTHTHTQKAIWMCVYTYIVSLTELGPI